MESAFNLAKINLKKIPFKVSYQHASIPLFIEELIEKVREVATPMVDHMTKTRKETELHKLGYNVQIEDHYKRWNILVNDVLPKMDVKEVARLLEWYIERSRAMVDGEIKFANAISRWEHDLQRLRKEFF